ncbi:hypothetical protein HDU92_003497 [Lobulomyces angularis]|nr:hypothetical protein HDU92_003497 [Lobulomyces angularis]
MELGQLDILNEKFLIATADEEDNLAMKYLNHVQSLLEKEVVKPDSIVEKITQNLKENNQMLQIIGWSIVKLFINRTMYDGVSTFFQLVTLNSNFKELSLFSAEFINESVIAAVDLDFRIDEFIDKLSFDYIEYSRILVLTTVKIETNKFSLHFDHILETLNKGFEISSKINFEKFGKSHFLNLNPKTEQEKIFYSLNFLLTVVPKVNENPKLMKKDDEIVKVSKDVIKNRAFMIQSMYMIHELGIDILQLLDDDFNRNDELPNVGITVFLSVLFAYLNSPSKKRFKNSKKVKFSHILQSTTNHIFWKSEEEEENNDSQFFSLLIDFKILFFKIFENRIEALFKLGIENDNEYLIDIGLSAVEYFMNRIGENDIDQDLIIKYDTKKILNELICYTGLIKSSLQREKLFLLIQKFFFGFKSNCFEVILKDLIFSGFEYNSNEAQLEINSSHLAIFNVVGISLLKEVCVKEFAKIEVSYCKKNK